LDMAHTYTARFLGIWRLQMRPPPRYSPPLILLSHRT
jgi:hypothetical protein